MMLAQLFQLGQLPCGNGREKLVPCPHYLIVGNILACYPAHLVTKLLCVDFACFRVKEEVFHTMFGNEMSHAPCTYLLKRMDTSVGIEPT